MGAQGLHLLQAVGGDEGGGARPRPGNFQDTQGPGPGPPGPGDRWARPRAGARGNAAGCAPAGASGGCPGRAWRRASRPGPGRRPPHSSADAASRLLAGRARGRRRIRRRQVFARAQAAVGAGVLDEHADPLQPARPVRGGGGVLAEDAQAAPAGPGQGGDAAHEGGLAGPVGAEEDEEVAPADAEVHALERLHGPAPGGIGDAKPLGLDHGGDFPSGLSPPRTWIPPGGPGPSPRRRRPSSPGTARGWPGAARSSWS